jgi:hypothetical protein
VNVARDVRRRRLRAASLDLLPKEQVIDVHVSPRSLVRPCPMGDIEWRR